MGNSCSRVGMMSDDEAIDAHIKAIALSHPGADGFEGRFTDGTTWSTQRCMDELFVAWSEVQQLKMTGAAAAWLPFAALLGGVCHGGTDAAAPENSKMVTDPKYFTFGESKTFMEGLPGMLNGSSLARSMAEEARDNDDGQWWPEFEYCVLRAAEEDVGLPSTDKFRGTKSISGETIVRDRGHAGMTLEHFCAHPMAQAASLTRAEVAALRLYTGPCYAPLNRALRTGDVQPWATTIACCFSAVLKLSFCSQPARVYRGVREDEIELPPAFVHAHEGKFAGGVERAFMSTTKNPAVALDYSGGAGVRGSVMAMDFDMASRGASVLWCSQYPHEEELIFPPCTGLSCVDAHDGGAKRCLLVRPQLSTARLDTAEVATPQHVPGTAQAQAWLADLLGGEEAPAERGKWSLAYKPLHAPEHVQRLSLLVGRAAATAAPQLRELALARCQLRAADVEVLLAALVQNASLTALDLRHNDLGAHGTAAVASALPQLRLRRLNLAATAPCGVVMLPDGPDYSAFDASGVAQLCAAASRSPTLESLDLSRNHLEGGRGACLLGGLHAVLQLSGSGQLSELALERNGLNDESLGLLAAALPALGALTSLSLAANDATAAGVEALAGVLPRCPSLKTLDLEGNEPSAALTTAAGSCTIRQSPT